MTRSRQKDSHDSGHQVPASHQKGEARGLETEGSFDANMTSSADSSSRPPPPPAGLLGQVRKAPGQDPMLGLCFNNLQIVSCLGRGGFGAVYMAEHTQLRTPFAVKVLNVFQSTRSVVVERFRREARAIAMLRHPHIVQVTDFGWLEGSGYYLVMEYSGTLNLSDALYDWDWQEAPFPVARTRRIMEQMSYALQWVHEHDIVHRDLKPSNILLSTDSEGEEQIKLIDFGIAALSDELSLTETGTCMGSPAYMSPEQARGSSAPIDGRSDLYSLGILLFHMLTGVLPFQGKGIASYIRLHVKEPPPRLQDVASMRDWDPGLEALIQFVLAKDPADRPADAMVFWSLCEQALLAQEALEQETLGEETMLTPAMPAMASAYGAHADEGATLATPTDSFLSPPTTSLLTPLRSAGSPQSPAAHPSALNGARQPPQALTVELVPAAETPAEQPPKAPTETRDGIPWRLVFFGLLLCFLAGSGVSWLLLAQKKKPVATPHTTSPRYEIHAVPVAAIFVGGKPLGQTPYFGEGVSGQRLVFQLRREGYQSLSIRWVLGNQPHQKRIFRLRPSRAGERPARLLPYRPLPPLQKP